MTSGLRKSVTFSIHFLLFVRQYATLCLFQSKWSFISSAVILHFFPDTIRYVWIFAGGRQTRFEKQLWAWKLWNRVLYTTSVSHNGNTESQSDQATDCASSVKILPLVTRIHKRRHHKEGKALVFAGVKIPINLHKSNILWKSRKTHLTTRFSTRISLKV